MNNNMNNIILEIDYDEPLFRPPSEAGSLILQITLGCSWNRCAFCEMYKSKRFTVRGEDEVIAEIKRAASYSPQVRKIFLADGNAMMLPTRRLMKILDTIKEVFPGVGRVSSYALPKNILAKSPEELKLLREAGLQLLYVGIESGDDDVLKMVNKGETAGSTVDGLVKAQDAGMNCSVMIINGLAGQEYSIQHAGNSAKIINKIQPRYLSSLVLMLPRGIESYSRLFKGKYAHMGTAGLLKELEMFIEQLELSRTIFRSDHASNFLPLKGTLSRDKEKLLAVLRSASSNSDFQDLISFFS
jgi:radical SAM superfamily enzyme YgiQ (UPF0313 family)